jgi:Xaa-Pro aminopeptidase
MKVIRIELPPFDYRIIVIIGKHSDALHYMRRLTGGTFDFLEDALGQCVYIKGWCPFIWLPRKPKTPKEISTAAHEAVHAALWLMDWAKVGASAGEDEFFGHTVGYIVKRILEIK